MARGVLVSMGSSAAKITQLMIKVMDSLLVVCGRWAVVATKLQLRSKDHTGHHQWLQHVGQSTNAERDK